MHQVLSYETAVRANSSREFREYVTKRTCVSLLLTIAFLTLILGYLLGNYVSERKFRMRQNLNKYNTSGQQQNSVEVSSADYATLKEISAYQKSKDELLSSAQTLSKMLQRDGSYTASSINSDIFNKYISCTQDIPPNTNIESSQFIEQLIDNTAARQRICLHVIQRIIDSNLSNG